MAVMITILSVERGENNSDEDVNGEDEEKVD